MSERPIKRLLYVEWAEFAQFWSGDDATYALFRMLGRGSGLADKWRAEAEALRSRR